MQETIQSEEIITKKDVFEKTVRSIDFNRVNQTTEALVNQQANIPETYLALTFTVPLDGLYIVTNPFLYSHNATNDNFIIEWEISNNKPNSQVEIVQKMSQESKDSFGQGLVANVIQGGSIIGNINTGTDALIPKSIKDILFFEKGVEYTIKMNFYSQSGNDEACIHNGYLSVKKNIE